MLQTKKYIFILFAVFTVIRANAQDTINSATVEQKSYQLYLDKKWPELIKFGNKAIHLGYDYFYLQMRIGIAYYEKKNYSYAEGHFKKALSFNSADDLALEYLYYCYIFKGRYDEARLLSKQFNDTLAKKIGIDNQSKVGFVMLEGGSKNTDSTSYYDKIRKTSSNYFNSPIYFQIGFNHYIKNRVSVFHALSYFNQQTFINRIGQTQYYLKMNIPTKNGWLISPAVHWVNIKTSNQILGPGMPPQQHPPRPGSPPQQQTVSAFANYFIGSLTIQKTIRKTVLALGTTVSNINSKTQFLHSGFVSYSVFGNSKLVVGCTGIFHTSDSYSTMNTSLSPFIYVQPINQFSLKLSYLNNTKSNVIEENGYLVNNSADLTKSRYSVLANFNISKKVALYGLYQLEYKQERVQLFNYQYNVFIAGLKITP